MAMYYYASKISAIACGTRCKRTVLQKSRGQRDRDKCAPATTFCAAYDEHAELDVCAMLASGNVGGSGIGGGGGGKDGVRLRRRHSDQTLDIAGACGAEIEFQNLSVSTVKSAKTTFTGYEVGNANTDAETVEYDIPKNTYKRSHSDVNYENSVLGSGGIMYINGRMVSGPLESLIEVLLPQNLNDLDKEFIFSFLLSSRLFLRPHELLGKLLSSVPDSGESSLESLVALLAEWTHKFPYDYRDERMMSHVKHIVARCSNTRLEGLVSEILSALLKRLTDLERHEEDLRTCQAQADKPVEGLACPTASQYAQILCRLEKKLAKHIGPEEFLQCSSNVLLDKQKKWDQPSTSGGPPGAQDPKKTCNLETYLDWSARVRLFVCNEILQCSGIRDRSRTVELWSGVAQYCLLVGNYNSATAILETLESPPLARLKITWSKLTVTCQQLDCMQRHAEGHGNLWQKQAIVLNENHQHHQQQHHHQKHETLVMQGATTVMVSLSTATSSSVTTGTITAPTTADTTLLSAATLITTPTSSLSSVPKGVSGATAAPVGVATTKLVDIDSEEATIATTTQLTATTILQPNPTTTAPAAKTIDVVHIKKVTASSSPSISVTTEASAAASTSTTTECTTTAATTMATTKPNDWVVIPVFADIVKLALAGREECLQRLPNGHINVGAFDRMAAIVGAFTKHMNTVKAATEAPTGEYEMFCRHMQQTTKLTESELMMASFDCEEPNNAEKLMYDLN